MPPPKKGSIKNIDVDAETAGQVHISHKTRSISRFVFRVVPLMNYQSRRILTFVFVVIVWIYWKMKYLFV